VKKRKKKIEKKNSNNNKKLTVASVPNAFPCSFFGTNDGAKLFMDVSANRSDPKQQTTRITCIEIPTEAITSPAPPSPWKRPHTGRKAMTPMHGNIVDAKVLALAPTCISMDGREATQKVQTRVPKNMNQAYSELPNWKISRV
jgi:hypothetical protein